MYGWRGKAGFVIPSICDTVLLELYELLPEGLLVTPVDLGVQNLTDHEFKEYFRKIEEAVKILAYEEVQIIIVTGTPPITKLGFDADKDIMRRVEMITGKPTSTGPTAEVDALRFLGLKRIALVTPFAEALNQHLKSYFEYCGFEVAVVKGINIVKNADLTKQSFSRSYTLAKEAFFEAKGMIDGILITCPRWPTVRSIAPLEKDLGIPVVTAAQSLAWKALTMLHVREVRPGHGRLFADFDQSKIE
jgi:maleate cis-trans isomerase